jgi:hypothetical protein
MKNKLINPSTHAVIDYGFAALQIIGPVLFGLNKKAVKSYAETGTAFLTVNSFTDTPLTVDPKISLETHKKIDAGFLAAQALMTFSPMIRNHKKTLVFHLAFLAMAAANFIMTDYRNKTSHNQPVQNEPIAV